LWFQDNEKSELVDVVSVMFQVGEWAWELIFCLLDFLKKRVSWLM
jgi:hypothetical protein